MKAKFNIPAKGKGGKSKNKTINSFYIKKQHYKNIN